MNKQTAEELTAAIQEQAAKKKAITGRDIQVFTERFPDDDCEIKVFERNSDGTISSAILSIVEYVELATKFDVNCYVKTEWRDGKGTKGHPFIFFF